MSCSQPGISDIVGLVVGIGWRGKRRWESPENVVLATHAGPVSVFCREGARACVLSGWEVVIEGVADVKIVREVDCVTKKNGKRY